MIVMAPSDEAELVHGRHGNIDDAPIAATRERGVGVDLPERSEILAIGKGRILHEGTKIALLSYGTRLQDCLDAAEERLRTVCPRRLPMRVPKPLDQISSSGWLRNTKFC